MSFQQQQLRVVKLDVFAPWSSKNERWNIARKLALICHYLNTRCRTGCQFFNGGVSNKSVDTDLREDGTVYMRVNENNLLNLFNPEEANQTKDGVLTNLMDDNEIRFCAQKYIEMIRKNVPELGFLNIIQ